jgi:YggT family protein
MSGLVLATVRGEVASFLDALLTVYTILILAYIVVSLLFSVGLRPPGYSRWFDALFGFLRDVSEPYLRIFRRFIPPLGPIDITPIVAIFVLQIVGGLIVGAIDDGT